MTTYERVISFGSITINYKKNTIFITNYGDNKVDWKDTEAFKIPLYLKIIGVLLNIFRKIEPKKIV